MMKKRKKKERRYYNVSVHKLAGSFEKQFFGAIMDGNIPNEEISPTLFTKFDKYNEMKDTMLRYIKYLFVVSLAMIGCGLGYFACMMINLLQQQSLPLNVKMAVPTSYLEEQEQGNYQLTSDFPSWVLIIISVILWAQFLLLGITGVYMR